MLTAYIFINERPIDQINIHNVFIRPNGMCDYEVVSSKTGKRLLDKLITHKRQNGYRPLLKKVLTELEKNGIGELK